MSLCLLHRMESLRNALRTHLRLSTVILYISMGYLIEQSGETNSMAFTQLPVMKEGWLVLYPLYLACRAQCFIFYLLYHSVPYQIGVFTLLVVWRYLLCLTLFSVPREICLPVFYEYLRPSTP